MSFPKRQRREPPPPPPKSPEERIRELVARLGEQRLETLPDNVYRLALILHDESRSHRDCIIDVIVDCVAVSSEKTTMYSTLIGLLAARQPELGSQIVASMSARLQACLGQSDFFRSRLLVRSFADLCAAGVVTAESAIAILRSCLAVTTERDSPQVRKDAYAELVMAAMPWIGPLLAERLTGSLDEFLEGIDSYLKTRRLDHVPLLVGLDGDPMAQEDALVSLWNQLKNLHERKWKEVVILRAYHGFADVFRDITQPYAIPAVIIPSHVELHNAEGLQPSTYPSPRVFMLLLQETDAVNNQLIPPAHSIERYLLRTIASDMFFANQDDFRLCVKRVVEIFPLYPNMPMAFVVIEAIFADMLQLPFPRVTRFAYSVIMAELIRQYSGTPALLTVAMDALLERLATMDTECITRYVEWMGHFLNFFEFKHRWDDWQSVVDEPANNPKRIFVREVLANALRLSFFARVSRSSPKFLAPLLPEPPVASYPFSNLSRDEARDMRIEKLTDAMRDKETIGDDLVSILKEVRVPEDVDRRLHNLNLLTILTLHLGVKSFSHLHFMLNKTESAIKELTRDDEAAEEVIVSAIETYWNKSQQLMVMVLDRFFLRDLLSARTIIRYTLRRLVDDFDRVYLWEILFNALSGLDSRASQAEQSLKEAQHRLEMEPDSGAEVEQHAADFEAAVSAQTDGLSLTLELLAKHITESDASNARRQTVLLGRAKEAIRRYLPHLGRKGVLAAFESVWEQAPPLMKRHLDAAKAYVALHNRVREKWAEPESGRGH